MQHVFMKNPDRHDWTQWQPKVGQQNKWGLDFDIR